MKKKTMITVTTHANGYELRTGGSRSYLYLNVEELVAGIYFHAGLGSEDYAKGVFLRGLKEIAEGWPDNRKQIEDEVRINSERLELSRQLQSANNHINGQQNEIDRQKQTIRELKKDIHDLTKRNLAFARLNDEQSRKILQLEAEVDGKKRKQNKHARKKDIVG